MESQIYRIFPIWFLHWFFCNRGSAHTQADYFIPVLLGGWGTAFPSHHHLFLQWIAPVSAFERSASFSCGRERGSRGTELKKCLLVLTVVPSIMLQPKHTHVFLCIHFLRWLCRIATDLGGSNHRHYSPAVLGVRSLKLGPMLLLQALGESLPASSGPGWLLVSLAVAAPLLSRPLCSRGVFLHVSQVSYSLTRTSVPGVRVPLAPRMISPRDTQLISSAKTPFANKVTV